MEEGVASPAPVGLNIQPGNNGFAGVSSLSRHRYERGRHLAKLTWHLSYFTSLNSYDVDALIVVRPVASALNTQLMTRCYKQQSDMSKLSDAIKRLGVSTICPDA